MRSLAFAFVFALAFAGCALPERGAGEETLVVTNDTTQTVEIILRIAAPGGVPVFSDDIVLKSEQSREFDLDMPPGKHTVYLTTSNGLSEVFPIEIPANGDSRIDVIVMRGTASVRVSS